MCSSWLVRFSLSQSSFLIIEEYSSNIIVNSYLFFLRATSSFSFSITFSFWIDPLRILFQRTKSLPLLAPSISLSSWLKELQSTYSIWFSLWLTKATILLRFHFEQSLPYSFYTFLVGLGCMDPGKRFYLFSAAFLLGEGEVFFWLISLSMQYFLNALRQDCLESAFSSLGMNYFQTRQSRHCWRQFICLGSWSPVQTEDVGFSGSNSFNQLLVILQQSKHTILPLLQSQFMSIKLPNIKKQQSPRSPKSHSRNGPPEEGLASEQQQRYGEDDVFEEVEESNPAPETVTALKAESYGHMEVEVTAREKVQPKLEQKEGPSLQQLEHKLSQKVKISTSLRASIQERKKEIKDIGEQIDKDLNKSLLKASKPNTVNIRDIFSGTHKTNSQAVQQINQQLNQTRAAIRKVKQQIQKTQDGLTDPVSLLNQDRGIEYKTKIKNTESEIKTIEHEKIMLEQEISRGGREFDEEEQKQKAEDLSKLHHELYEIQNHQKEQKLKLYHIEKEDIILMEKVKFFQERQNHLGVKRSKISQSQKEQIQLEMRQLIIDINQTMEERNKTEMQQRKLIKQLNLDITSLETKNWEFFNKLREIDAFLLQYYEKKTRKKEVKQIQKMQKTIDVMEKPASKTKIETHSVASETLNKSKFSVNDKNMLSQVPLVEKKKNYEFGHKQPLAGQINLSDDFLGQKLVIKSVQIGCAQSKILSINARYVNQFGNQVHGLMMGSKNIPEKVDTRDLVLEKQEVINFVHTGYNEENVISFLHFVTSEGKELKWGSLENLTKSQQKHIKKYQSCLIKAKLVHKPASQQEQFSPFLAGLSLLTTYMSPK